MLEDNRKSGREPDKQRRIERRVAMQGPPSLGASSSSGLKSIPRSYQGPSH